MGSPGNSCSSRTRRAGARSASRSGVAAHLVPAGAALPFEPPPHPLPQRLGRAELLTQTRHGAEEALLEVLVPLALFARGDVCPQPLSALGGDLFVEVVPEVVQYLGTCRRQAELLQLRAGRSAHHRAPAPWKPRSSATVTSFSCSRRRPR